ncbi:acyltransferase family protein [Mycolicibacterium wolinskyi]|uniref:Glycerol acyltransferase n=1 Tax=Mycolicibacterium wolinskyi TaxID=59750 RepID=A0A1X2F488_9MYCO|nr:MULTISPECIES: lysophospholipid acyltransferase family protein [Mycolicibacterium]MCV7289855.1 acyltransferase family protein [Mycolicibacterium wolinskyi]MCV7297882.1 acyltransferase family protein [Mycolicibacterium goodii]ORX13241.1 glycerol acyltransferase [Mycolicibacterium wolinskyi]
MTVTKIDAIMKPASHIQVMRRAVETVADGIEPLVDLYRPYVDGLHNLPRDGRFLLVGNHTQFGAEALLIPYVVRREIGMRVRPLTYRRFGDMPGPAGDLLAACGAVVGAPESARELMRHDEPILVFPGGGREIPKFKGEQYTLRWEGRAGFARIAAEHAYPIVPVALVGGDDVYVSVTTRDHWLGRLSETVSEKLSGRTDMAMPLLRGVGPTLIPRPQRMYVRFAAPVDTTKPARMSAEKWTATVRQNTKESLEQSLAELLKIRSDDPYRELNPLAWRRATRPATS